LGFNAARLFREPAAVQRTITVGDETYDDLDEARAEAPIIYGLDPDLDEAYLGTVFAANRDYVSVDAWRADIEREFTLPANRRIGVLNTLNHYAIGGYRFTWNGGQGKYAVTRADGTALPKNVWLTYQWVDNFGYANLGRPVETAADIDFTLRAPLRYWPTGANPRNQHASRILTPSLTQLGTEVSSLVGAGAAGALLAGPAVFVGAGGAGGAAPNAADRALVARFMGTIDRSFRAQRDLALHELAGNAAAVRNDNKILNLERVLLVAMLAEPGFGPANPDLPGALRVLREIAAEQGEPAEKIEYALDLIRNPIQHVQTATAMVAQNAHLGGAGLGALADFEDDSILSNEVVRHVAFAAPRPDGQFLAMGISGGHVERELRDFLRTYPEYDVLEDIEGGEYTVYNQFKWIPAAGMNVADREDRRPSGDGGLHHHNGWEQAQYPKTVAANRNAFLQDAEASFRAWHAANLGAVAAIAPGGRIHVGPFASIGSPGIGYEAYLERHADTSLHITTIYPVLG
jgi:hypothetical protein